MNKDILNDNQTLILLVDDNFKNLQVLGTILENRYKTAVATSGFEALNFLKNRKPDLILLDIVMPEMSGLDLCRQIKSSPETKEIPVIFVTAKTQIDDVVKGFDAGAVDYITKPFHSTELLVRVHTHIDLRKKTLLLKAISQMDGLTMIPNRRHFDEFLSLEMRRCSRERQPLSVIMIDVDYFKLYNDFYGHIKGDDCLKLVAEVIRRSAKRPGDLPARYGGEEFSVVLGNTGLDNALMIARKICSDIEGLKIPHKGSKANNVVTVSIGAASVIPGRETSPAWLIEQADKCLYKAKQEGRNRVKP